jgi:hypothetical protein
MVQVGVLGAVLGGPAPTAVATSPVPRVNVGIGAYAKFDEGGVGVWIRVAGMCTPGADVLESFVYVNQDGFSTESSPIPLRCDGSLHRSKVLVPMADVPLHKGPATASAYALVVDPDTGETAQDSPSRDITILP